MDNQRVLEELESLTDKERVELVDGLKLEDLME